MLQGLPKTFQGSHLRMKSSTWFDQYMRICLERFSLESGFLPKLCQGSQLRRKSSAWFAQYRRIYLERFSLEFGLLGEILPGEILFGIWDLASWPIGARPKLKFLKLHSIPDPEILHHIFNRT